MRLLDVIKFEGDESLLIWKHPAEDFNNLSKLIVHESQEAVLFKDGKIINIFGPGKYTLNSENIPILQTIINIPTMGISQYHCEVYFINKIASMNMEWGTPTRFQVLDPEFGVPLNVGASGSMELRITDSTKFLVNVVGTRKDVTNQQLMFYFKERIITKIKSYLATIMSEVSYINVNKHLGEISDTLKDKLNEDYAEYGITLLNFYVSTIIVPEEDTLKIKEVLNKKMEYGTFNIGWADEQKVEISKRYAENPGNQNNIGGMMAQVPLSMAFGEMLKENTMGSSENSSNNNSNLFNHNNSTSDEFYCYDCGTKLVKGAKFCHGCGKNYSENNSCPNCGCETSQEYKFCMNCGYKLK
jgi:membrane protease subunit (stomatin/prohibitin family)